MLLETPRDVGVALREHRRRLGLDQAELAQRVGVSRKWVIDWVVDAKKGNAGAGIGVILKAFAATGIGFTIAGSEPSSDTVPLVDIVDDRGGGRV